MSKRYSEHLTVNGVDKVTMTVNYYNKYEVDKHGYYLVATLDTSEDRDGLEIQELLITPQDTTDNLNLAVAKLQEVKMEVINKLISRYE